MDLHCEVMLVFTLQRDVHHLSFGPSEEFELWSANHTFHFVFMAQLAPGFWCKTSQLCLRTF